MNKNQGVLNVVVVGYVIMVYKNQNVKNVGDPQYVHMADINQCKECGGYSICDHGRRWSECKECGRVSICIHNRNKSYCKEGRRNQVCEHSKIKSSCKECVGSQICSHKILKKNCKICDPNGYLRQVVSSRVRDALKSKKSKGTLEYLCCDIDTFKKHIEDQFEEGMSWDNYGEWEIDHVVPVKFNNPNLQQVIERLHYTNTQPLWKAENIAKGNRFCGKKYDKTIHNIDIMITNCEKRLEKDKMKQYWSIVCYFRIFSKLKRRGVECVVCRTTGNIDSCSRKPHRKFKSDTCVSATEL